MLCQLVDKLGRLGDGGNQIARQLSVALFEKSDRFGPGVPHSDRYVLPFHITNMCASDMSVRCDRPGEFQDWVEQNHSDLLEPDPAAVPSPGNRQSDPCRHYPRAAMGDYLASQFDSAVAAARRLGITIELYTSTEVTGLEEINGTCSLELQSPANKSPEQHIADSVLLATGHWFGPEQGDNYFPSPWPAAKLLENIPPGERVGVIGSSLSAIEVALTLTSDGRFVRQDSGELSYIPPGEPRTVVLHSRNGLLPRVRGRTGTRSNRYLTCENIRNMIEERPGELGLEAVFELLDKELEEAYGSPIDWQSVVEPTGDARQRLQGDIIAARYGDGPGGELVWQTALTQIFPVVRELYLHLTLSERQRFDRNFTTLFFMHAATQPVINAEKVLALMRARLLSVVKLGKDYSFGRNETGEYEFVYFRGGKSRKDTFRSVVNARGQPRSVEKNRTRLFRNLLENGTICIEETDVAEPAGALRYRTGSIVVDPETHRIVRPGSRTSSSSPSLYAVGAMTRGQMIDASMAYGLSRSTATIADNLIEQLRQRAAG